MGTFYVDIGVGHPLGGDFLPVSALVDTGSHSFRDAGIVAGILESCAVATPNLPNCGWQPHST